MFSIVNEFEPTNKVVLYKVKNYCYSLNFDNSDIWNNQGLYNVILFGLILVILGFSLSNCVALYKIRQYIKKRGEK
jgi:hypothetical protein